MSRAIHWIKDLLGLGREEEEPLEIDEQEVDGDPFSPRGDRASILARVKLDAEADAIRHAEDMLNRDFPVVTRAEDTAETRLTTLRSAYVERRGELAGRIAVLEQNATELNRRLQETERALAAEGVPALQISLEPPRGRRSLSEPILIALGSLLVMGVAVKLLDLQGQLVLPAVGLLAGLVLLALILQPDAQLEDPAVTALREQRQELDLTLTELQEDLQTQRETLTRLETTTYAMVESEVRFAGEMALTYNSTVFSSLPAGVLAEGRELKEQRRPEVKIPNWARGLTGAE
jgi:hypothetical protein